MYHVKAGSSFERTISINKDQVMINNSLQQWSMVPLEKNIFSIICNGKSFVAEVIPQENGAKKFLIKIQGRQYDISIAEPIDQLLAAMGMQAGVNKKVNNIKAPMPGMVLKILVQPGQKIKQGDPVIILEAMKMENVFKSPADAVVKKIAVLEKTAVEKGEILVILE